MKTEIRAKYIFFEWGKNRTNEILNESLIKIQKEHKVIDIKLQIDRDSDKHFLIIYEVEVPTLQLEQGYKCKDCKYWYPTLDFSGSGECVVTRCSSDYCNEWKERE